MKPRKAILAVSLCLLGLSLTSGYYLIGNRIGLAASIFFIVAWLVYWRFAQTVSGSGFASSLPPVFLFVSVGLAVSGLLLGVSAILMIVSTGLSLAVWDLLALDIALSGQPLEERGRRYEARHLHSLAMALGAGCLVSLGARLINFRVPFVVLLLVVAFVVFALDRIWAVIVTRGPD